MDLSAAKNADEHPKQPVQGIQAASLLVSMAKRKVWAGVPTLALTIYVGLCIICRPEATGTKDFLPVPTKLEKYWSLAWSLACIWSTLSSHDSGSEGLNGEHGLETWKTWRVEPWSDVSHFGLRPWTREMQRRRASEKRWGSRERVELVAMTGFEGELSFDIGLLW